MLRCARFGIIEKASSVNGFDGFRGFGVFNVLNSFGGFSRLASGCCAISVQAMKFATFIQVLRVEGNGLQSPVNSIDLDRIDQDVE